MRPTMKKSWADCDSDEDDPITLVSLARLPKEEEEEEEEEEFLSIPWNAWKQVPELRIRLCSFALRSKTIVATARPTLAHWKSEEEEAFDFNSHSEEEEEQEQEDSRRSRTSEEDREKSFVPREKMTHKTQSIRPSQQIVIGKRRQTSLQLLGESRIRTVKTVGTVGTAGTEEKASSHSLPNNNNNVPWAHPVLSSSSSSSSSKNQSSTATSSRMYECLDCRESWLVTKCYSQEETRRCNRCGRYNYAPNFMLQGLQTLRIWFDRWKESGAPYRFPNEAMYLSFQTLLQIGGHSGTTTTTTTPFDKSATYTFHYVCTCSQRSATGIFWKKTRGYLHFSQTETCPRCSEHRLSEEFLWCCKLNRSNPDAILCKVSSSSSRFVASAGKTRNTGSLNREEQGKTLKSSSRSSSSSSSSSSHVHKTSPSSSSSSSLRRESSSLVPWQVDESYLTPLPSSVPSVYRGIQTQTLGRIVSSQTRK